MAKLEDTIGHWHKLEAATRCDYCGKPTTYLFVVKEGPTTGRFCSKGHFIAAYQHMYEEGKGANNEKTKDSG